MANTKLVAQNIHPQCKIRCKSGVAKGSLVLATMSSDYIFSAPLIMPIIQQNLRDRLTLRLDYGIGT